MQCAFRYVAPVLMPCAYNRDGETDNESYIIGEVSGEIIADSEAQALDLAESAADSQVLELYGIGYTSGRIRLD